MQTRWEYLQMYLPTRIFIYTCPKAQLQKMVLRPELLCLRPLPLHLHGKKVKKFLAMTGEITLRGRVLPVGGIKEKILAAKRADIKEIILCSENRKDIEEINKDFLKGLTFHYVSNMMDVLAIALPIKKVFAN